MVGRGELRPDREATKKEPTYDNPHRLRFPLLSARRFRRRGSEIRRAPAACLVGRERTRAYHVPRARSPYVAPSARRATEPAPLVDAAPRLLGPGGAYRVYGPHRDRHAGPRSVERMLPLRRGSGAGPQRLPVLQQRDLTGPEEVPWPIHRLSPRTDAGANSGRAG